LHSLSVTWLSHDAYLEDELPNEAHFTGKGSTPDEKQASMQQQLHSMCNSPAFLSPESWPTHHCLSKLELNNGLGAQHAPMCSSALAAVASLQSLTVCTPDPAELAVCRGLSRLSSLTHLKLWATENGDGLLADLSAEVACLASLASLQLDEYAFGCEVDCIPSSWSRLSSLTSLHLHLGGCDLQLSSLSGLTAMQAVVLVACTAHGGVAQLCALPALTKLQGRSIKRAPEGGDAAADSAAAQAASAAARAARACGGPAPAAVLQGVRKWAPLCEVTWPFSWGDMQVLSQLTTVTKLTLVAADACPELWW
jgi:hypothetical protein